MKRKYEVLLLLLPILVLVALGLALSRHPQELRTNSIKASPANLDERARKLLTSADTIRVEIETVYCWGSEGPTCGPDRKFVAWLSPKELRLLVSRLKLTKAQPSSWGTGYVPALYFIFYKGGYQKETQQGSLSIGYGGLPYEYFTDYHTGLCRGLQPTTVRLFRQLVARHPEMRKALKAAGVQPKALNAG